MDGLTAMPWEDQEGGKKRIRFRCGAGLFQFSLFLDAAEFDWESLYQVLNAYGNENERTGPWDFDLKTARPLVPSYWVHLDGRKLGLWYVQRVSLDDMRDRRFRGRLAFLVKQAGEHELTFDPFQPMLVSWLAARLESDPEDRLTPGLKAASPPSALPSAVWGDPGFWAALRRKVETTHGVYREPVRKMLDWTKAETGGPDAIPFLVAAHHLDGQDGALEKALRIVDETVALLAWGRPREDVYGHNGDIGGAAMLRNMAWAYHMLGPHLGGQRRGLLLDKLVYQGNAFLTQALLMRDYWGGSLLQDHGRQAMFDFGTAALQLWGLHPAAEDWVAYAQGRNRRALEAAPTDGVIPGSSYYALHMYTQNVMWYRDSWLARTGEDLLDHPSLRCLPAFVRAVTDERECAMLVSEGDRAALLGAQPVMNALAVRHGDADAAWAHDLMLARVGGEGAVYGGAMTSFLGVLWGFVAYDPAVAALRPAPRPSRHLRWYEESGFVHYRNDPEGVVLALRCGPWLGYRAHRLALGPCDRMECLPGAGHFVLFLEGKPLLCSPETGYSLRSALRTCMLVDDHGQIGDVGYPMSLPSQPHRGDEIETVRWDAGAGTGLIRLNLQRAYPAEAGVTHYTREFLVAPGRRIICRDSVVLARPCRLSWLFQFRADSGGVLEPGGRTRIGRGPVLCVEPRPVGLELDPALRKTRVVYSYSTSGSVFEHVRYAARTACVAATVDFVLSW